MAILSKIISTFNTSAPVVTNCAQALTHGRRYVPLYSLWSKNILSSIGRARQFSTKGYRKATIEKFRAKDNVPDTYDLIYRSTMTAYLFATQMISSFGLLTLFALVVAAFTSENKFKIEYSEIKLRNILQSEKQILIFSLGFMALYTSVVLLISKCPVRIYFNSSNRHYMGVIYGKLPTTKNIVEYKIGEIVHTPSAGMLPWAEFKYKLKNGQSLVLLDHNFRKPDDINIMLGYTKL